MLREKKNRYEDEQMLLSEISAIAFIINVMVSPVSVYLGIVFAKVISAKHRIAEAPFVRYNNFMPLFTAALTLIRLSCINKYARVREYYKFIQNS